MATKKKAAPKAKPNLIKAYKPYRTEIDLEGDKNYIGLKNFGGWNAAKNVFTPIQYDKVQEHESFLAMTFAMDNIAVAMEAGAIDSVRFVEQCFATRDDFEEFCESMRNTEEYWVNERHYRALLEIVGGEEGAVSYPIAGEALYEAYAEGNE